VFKLEHMSGGWLADVLARLQVRYPEVQVVFPDSRRFAEGVDLPVPRRRARGCGRARSEGVAVHVRLSMPSQNPPLALGLL
jgi:hypothetical protein